MRDGIKFFHLVPAPKAFPHNHPAISRAAEIEGRKKVFQLRFRGYIEKEFVTLPLPGSPGPR